MVFVFVVAQLCNKSKRPHLESEEGVCHIWPPSS